MGNDNLDEWKKFELFPRLYEEIDRAFPQMKFKRISKGDKWASKYHLNGLEDGDGKQITQISKTKPYSALDCARNEKRGLIDLYMDLNGKDFHTALKELADICHISIPERDKAKWEEYKQNQDEMERANQTFINALWSGSPEAEKALTYLREKRKWTDAEIKRAELGLITMKIKKSLSNSEQFNGVCVKDDTIIGGIGSTHIISIPYRNGCRLLGFKFRDTFVKSENPQETKHNSYLNSKNLPKNSYFFGLGMGIKDVVIVESELDALHAQIKGLDNVVATAGGPSSEKQIADAVSKGAERFTLLFDNDEAGEAFIAPAVRHIQKEGKPIYVASIPNNYKDVDEFLAEHSGEELQESIRKASAYSIYLLKGIISRFKEQLSREEPQPKDKENFLSKIEEAMNVGYTSPFERTEQLRLIESEAPALSVNAEEIKEWLMGAYLRRQDKKREEDIKRKADEVKKLAEDGKADEAVKLMGETVGRLKAQTKSVEFANVFAPPTDVSSMLSQIRDGIPTGIRFEQNNIREDLELNAGLTFICGYRGHGKTSFLNNIALNEAKRNLALGSPKKVLYFSYEVEKRMLILDLLNTFVNDPDLSSNPLKSLRKYYRGETEWIRRDHLQNFKLKEAEFFKNYLGSGAITIVDEPYKVETLLDAIKYYTSVNDTSIVCIDYAQLIYSEDYSRQRTEEIKKVVNDIKDFANEVGLPFVLAAQFNREVESPVSVDTKNIGEGGDFERIADTCIGLFNLKELHPLPRNSEEQKNARRLLEDLGLIQKGMVGGNELKPIYGKLFVRLMKRRYGYYPLDIVLDWEGRTKHIGLNNPKALEPEQKGLSFDEPTEEKPQPSAYNPQRTAYNMEDMEEEDLPF